jgi:hypothetical protein
LNARARVVRTEEILFDRLDLSGEVYFPCGDTVISLVRVTDEGPQMETAMIGSEGFASPDVLFARAVNAESVGIVQGPGEVACVSIRRLDAELSADSHARGLMLAYSAMYLDHVSQNAVCNGVHSIPQRLAKWLLMLRDRSGSDDLLVSHDLVSRMLGIQRAAVTLAVGILTDKGLLSHSRRHIHICDAAALRKRACACVDVVTRGLGEFRAKLN